MIKIYGLNCLKGCGDYLIFGNLYGSGTGTGIRYSYFIDHFGNGKGKGINFGNLNGEGYSSHPIFLKEEYTK